MPIGRTPPLSNRNALRVMPDDVLAGEDLTRGEAVAIVDNAGDKEVVLCAADSNAAAFVGFADATVSAGARVPLTTGRGSVVAPTVVGGGGLTEGSKVYLTTTAGAVSHTPPAGPGATVLPIGTAISTTEIVLTTDQGVAV